MLSPEERNEILQATYQNLIEIEAQISHNAGSYEYLCLLDGGPTFTHSPVGSVIRRVFHVPRDCREVA